MLKNFTPTHVNKNLFMLFLLFSAMLSVTSWAFAQQIYFQDDFTNGLATGQWNVYDNNHRNGLTQFGNSPQVANDVNDPNTKFIRLKLDSYNPDRDQVGKPFTGKPFKGTEIYSVARFGPDSPDITKRSATGYEFEARVRFTTPRSGIVGAFWTYHNYGSDSGYDDLTDDSYQGYEIDIEMLPKQSDGIIWNKFHLANFRNFNESEQRKNDNGGDAYTPNNQYHSAEDISAVGFNYSQWHYEKIVWTPYSSGWRVQTFVKMNLGDTYQRLRDERQAAPDRAMTVRFNLWAPDGKFGIAHDPLLPTAQTPSENQSYYLDVDWVKVTAAPTMPLPLVTQINGISNPNGRTFSSLDSIAGSVSNSDNSVSMVNAIIARNQDGKRWQGYTDAGGPPRWVDGSVGISTNYSTSNVNWTTTGTMPPSSQLQNGTYTIVADAVSNGNYIPSANIQITIFRINGSAGDARVSLNWDAIQGATSYRIHRRKHGEGYSGIPLATVAATTAISLTYADAPVGNSLTYYYIVQPIYANGTSSDSNEISLTPSAPLPSPVLNGSAGDARVTLNWNAVQGATSYRIHKRKHGEGYSGTPVAIRTDSIPAPYVDTSVNNTYTYYYFVQAVNYNGTPSSSNEISRTPSPPLPAPVLTGSAGNSRVTLNWNAVQGATSYRIYKRAHGAGYSGNPLATVGNSITTYNDTTVVNGYAYYYIVQAINYNGTPSDSNEISATPSASSYR